MKLQKHSSQAISNHPSIFCETALGSQPPRSHARTQGENKGKILATISLLIVIFSMVASTQQAVAQPTSPTFVWYFGYVGNTFYPQTQLGLSPQQLIAQAASISASVGPANLRLVSA